uniref:Uncharacterized protein n=1 Tax=Ixodes ricinus TaxID=34613 RepID=A0A0K8RFF6_IXORI
MFTAPLHCENNLNFDLTPFVNFERSLLSANNVLNIFNGITPRPIKVCLPSPNVLDDVEYLGFVLREKPYHPDDPTLIHKVQQISNKFVFIIDESTTWKTDATAGGYVYAIDLSSTNDRGRYLCSLDHLYRLLNRHKVNIWDAFAFTKATKIRDPSEKETNNLLWYNASLSNNSLIHEIVDSSEYIRKNLKSLYTDEPIYRCKHKWGAWIIDILRGTNANNLRQSELNLWKIILQDNCPKILNDAVCMLYGPVTYFRIFSSLKTNILPTSGIERTPITNYTLPASEIKHYLAPLSNITNFTPTIAKVDDDQFNNAIHEVTLIINSFKRITNIWLSFLYSDPNVIINMHGECLITQTFKIKWTDLDYINFKYVFTKEDGNLIEFNQKDGPLGALNYLLLLDPREMDNGLWNAICKFANTSILPNIEIITACRIAYIFDNNDNNYRLPNNLLPITAAMRRRCSYVVRSCYKHDWVDFVLETMTNNNKIFSDNGMCKQLAVPVSNNDVGWPIFNFRQYDNGFKLICEHMRKHMGVRIKKFLITTKLWKSIVSKYGGFPDVPMRNFSMGPIMSIIYDKYLDYHNVLFGDIYCIHSEAHRSEVLIPQAISTGEIVDIPDNLYRAVKNKIAGLKVQEYYETSMNILNDIIRDQRTIRLELGNNDVLDVWSPHPKVWFVLHDNHSFLVRHHTFNDVIPINLELYNSIRSRWAHRTRLSLLRSDHGVAQPSRMPIQIGSFTHNLETLYYDLIHTYSKYELLFANKYNTNFRLDIPTVMLIHYLFRNNDSYCLPITNNYKLSDANMETITKEIFLSNLFGTRNNDYWNTTFTPNQTLCPTLFGKKLLMCRNPIEYVNDVLRSYNASDSNYRFEKLSFLEITYCIDQWLLKVTYRPVTSLTCPLNVLLNDNDTINRQLLDLQVVASNLLKYPNLPDSWKRVIPDAVKVLTGLSDLSFLQKNNTDFKFSELANQTSFSVEECIKRILQKTGNIHFWMICNALQTIDLL